MLENKKKRSVLSFLIILNFILIIICLVRIKFSYAKVEKYTNMASNEYKDDYTKKINNDIIGSINLGNKTYLLTQKVRFCLGLSVFFVKTMVCRVSTCDFI